jgi:hypothetical protein
LYELLQSRWSKQRLLLEQIKQQWATSRFKVQPEAGDSSTSSYDAELPWHFWNALLQVSYKLWVTVAPWAVP